MGGGPVSKQVRLLFLDAVFHVTALAIHLFVQKTGRVCCAFNDVVVMPRKGKLSKAHQQIEQNPEFVKARRQHSAVESGINALEVHGLDRCPDRGLEHFKHYVALAVVGRNLQKLGAILQANALAKQQREERRRCKT